MRVKQIYIVLPPSPFEENDRLRVQRNIDNAFEYEDIFWLSKQNDLINSEDSLIVLVENKYRKTNKLPPSVQSIRRVTWSFYGNKFLSNGIIEIGEDQEIESHIFNKIIQNKRNEFGILPYGYSHRSTLQGYINEFGFRVPKDYQNLKHRDKDHKLVCVVGGSACYSSNVQSCDMFTKKIEQQLNKHFADQKSNCKYTVLNFGMHGHLILNEIITYVLFIEQLCPDVVISYDGWNDMVSGMATDRLLKEKFDFNYILYFEQWAKKLHESNENLKWSSEKSIHNRENTPKVIIEAYINRLEQFERLVVNSGAKFVSVLQPGFFSKKALSEYERLGIDFYHHPSGTKNEYQYIEVLYQKLSRYIKKYVDLAHHLDLHLEFYQYDENFTLFSDAVHTTIEGDSYIAKNIVDFLFQRRLA